jgi:hypothetical protein
MKKISVLIVVMVCGMLASSCSTKCPSLNDPEKGIVAISVESSNTSAADFSYYYKIFPYTHSDYTIKIYPKSGKSFAFSPAMEPGRYDFNTIRTVPFPKGHNAYTGTVLPGAITIISSKFVIEQVPDPTSGSGDYAWITYWKMVPTADNEMKDLIEEFKRMDTDGQWKIVNEL